MGSNAWKWGIGAAALLGVGVLAVGSAAASTNDSPGGGTGSGGTGPGLSGTGVRHGIKYDGCSHFELADADAVEAWALDNKLRFIKWATKLDEVRANPEPLVLDIMSALFPECPWPPAPSTTFTPQRVSWAETMTQVREAASDFDLAGGSTGSGSSNVEREFGRLFALALRGQSLGARRG
ncbi:MAG: hypothetical protein K0V04_31635 [Deltaproteobacteria bacterium]|nr:hypothetical protein [Deltaproteobacteria bacterium]